MNPRKQITQGPWEDNDFVWSIDGRQIYFTKSHLQESDDELPKSDLFVVPASGGATRNCSTRLTWTSGRIAPSPDGNADRVRCHRQ